MRMKSVLLIILFFCCLKLESASGKRYDTLCGQHKDCGGHLRCLKVDDLKLCRCRGIQKYDRHTDDCMNGIGSVCKINEGPPCEPGSSCQEISRGAYSCLSTAPTTPLRLVHLSECTNDEDCEKSKTYLSCRGDDDGGPRKCTCRAIEEFNQTKNQCVRKIGAHCRFQPEQAPKENVQSCVSHGICLARLNLQNQFRSDGQCCLRSDPTVCSEFSTQVAQATKTPPIPGSKCTKHDDCELETTFLKCLLQNNSKICSCGSNNRFNPDTRHCELGLGMACYHLPSYPNPNPQQCVPEATCKSLGKAGKCECRAGTRCDRFKSPTPEPSPSWHPYRGYACIRCWDPSLQFLSLLLFFTISVAITL